MKTKFKNFKKAVDSSLHFKEVKFMAAFALMAVFALLISKPASAHCDSYDGPVIIDARIALEKNKPELIYKWITKEQEEEVSSLFKKTVALKSGDPEIYRVVEKYFFETLVRLHRETEGAPYTGLKAAGTTKQIVQMSDQALATGNISDLTSKLNKHIENVIMEKYQKTAELNKKKNESVETGREFVEAYVDYTHTLEAIHDILEHGGGAHSGH